MGLEALLARMEGRTAVTPDTPGVGQGVTSESAPILGCTRVTPVTPNTSSSANPSPIADRAPRKEDAGRPNEALQAAAVEARRQCVLTILERHPGLKYAVVTDSQSEPGVVIVHLAIRGQATGELIIDKARYDPVQLMRCMDRVNVEDLREGRV